MTAKKDIATMYTIVLLGILAGGMILFWLSKGQTALQIAIGIVIASFYVVWGILRHREEGDLHPKVVIEYVLVAAIAVVLLLTLAV